MEGKWKQLRIHEREYNLLKELAKEEGVPISTLAGKLVDHYIGCMKKGKIEARVAEALEYTEEIQRLLKAWRMP